ncbi:MAG: DUF3592 domain-containing protein [Clostridiaceae bacterium]|nr:DUF3592 domain-containing protein [Clostridiaceae bacterium]
MSNSQQSRYTPPVDPARAVRRLWISAAVLALVGILVLGYSFLSAARRGADTADYVEVQGKVVGHQEKGDLDRASRPSVRYAEIVEYRVQGRTYKIVSNISKSSPAAIGTVLQVSYDPDDPSQAILIGAVAQTDTVLRVTGAAVLALGIFLMVQRVRATRDKAKSG